MRKPSYTLECTIALVHINISTANATRHRDAVPNTTPQLRFPNGYYGAVISMIKHQHRVLRCTRGTAHMCKYTLYALSTARDRMQSNNRSVDVNTPMSSAFCIGKEKPCTGASVRVRDVGALRHQSSSARIEARVWGSAGKSARSG